MKIMNKSTFIRISGVSVEDSARVSHRLYTQDIVVDMASIAYILWHKPVEHGRWEAASQPGVCKLDRAVTFHGNADRTFFCPHPGNGRIRPRRCRPPGLVRICGPRQTPPVPSLDPLPAQVCGVALATPATACDGPTLRCFCSRRRGAQRFHRASVRAWPRRRRLVAADAGQQGLEVPACAA